MMLEQCSGDAQVPLPASALQILAAASGKAQLSIVVAMDRYCNLDA